MTMDHGSMIRDPQLGIGIQRTWNIELKACWPPHGVHVITSAPEHADSAWRFAQLILRT